MILSSSRRTDIPAFYSNWFFNRIEAGYIMVRNPINKKQVSKIILKPELIDCIVFWSKNPQQMIPKLPVLDKLGYKYYFQFTLNSYSKEIELNVPSKNEIIKTFINLATQIGKRRVIWRYDPILLTRNITVDYHIKYFERIAKKLANYTEKCIISFIDFYQKCQRNLKDLNPITIDDETKIELAKVIKNISNKYNIQLETCAEDIELSNINIFHGKCIDDKLIEDLCGGRIKVEKDKNQREACGCVTSIDIGSYNTCKHNCLYCYANYNRKIVDDNFLLHNPESPLLLGNISNDDKISVRKIKSNIIKQNSLFQISNRD